ncbi:MAG: tRNA (guanosine(46)-N7)-methyltransferase TrmB [Gemmataceae bacterium]|nr:tRNA (guanosine(46)-N7)-methyltransferase TrmB [Gemmataceae bacterium]
MTRSVRLSLEQLQPYLLDVPPPRLPPGQVPSEPPQPLRWSEVFGSDQPVEIEVGFGKGAFLTQVCQSRPTAHFLGIEIERKYVLMAAGRIAKLAPKNVRLACTDAKWFFSNRVASSSVDVVHVFFPDPWWKNRHKKRKLMSPDFVADIGRVLKPGGIFHFKTDVKDYFEQTQIVLGPEPTLREEPDSAYGLDGAMTNFERKYRIEGRPIYRAIYSKRDAS